MGGWRKNSMNHIELFAGCGGLCLGLSATGFELEFANELSPMAAETFAYNIIGENLLDNPLSSKKTLWLQSGYSRTELKKRLRENPLENLEYIDKKYHDLENIKLNDETLRGCLIVGNICLLNAFLKKNQKILSRYQDMDIDLVSGGPPCQSFSLAGLREQDSPKNKLPWEFANFVSKIRPKCVLLENVSGIMSPFKDKSTGKKYYAWFEVAKVFAQSDYVPLTLHINAKFAGVAQNRPRFILIAVRRDTFLKLMGSFNDSEKKLFSSSEFFFNKIKLGESVEFTDLIVHDLNNKDQKVFKLFKTSFLNPLCKIINEKEFVSVEEAIGDLTGDSKDAKGTSEYVKKINLLFNKHIAKISPHECTDNNNRRVRVSPRVERRYRLYQVMSYLDQNKQREIRDVLSGKREIVSGSVWKSIKGYDFLVSDPNFIGQCEKNVTKKMTNKESFEFFLANHRTKKHSQKCLVKKQPAPAALSIPDDTCHYDEPRTLTAREMARIQSFPDNFIFRSKMTTGGGGRKFEVPIYTQIGNAVPVLLGYALGKCVKNLLTRSKRESK